MPSAAMASMIGPVIAVAAEVVGPQRVDVEVEQTHPPTIVARDTKM
jgi:hypothetical protein